MTFPVSPEGLGNLIALRVMRTDPEDGVSVGLITDGLGGISGFRCVKGGPTVPVGGGGGGTPGNPTAVIGFEAVNGSGTPYMRASAAPALGLDLVVPADNDFHLSTLTDLGSTDDRGDIFLTGGNNDTYGGATATVAGGYNFTCGEINLTGGSTASFFGASLNVGGATGSAGGGISFSGNTVECQAENGISFTTNAEAVTLTSGDGNVISVGNGTALMLGLSGVTLQLGSDAGGGAAEFPGQLAMWGDNFGGVADTRLGVVHAIAATSDATPTELSTSAAGKIVLTNDSSYIFDCQIVARNIGADDETAAFSLTGVIRRGATAADTAVVGTATAVVLAADTGALTWTCTFTADTTNGRPNISVVGEAAKDIRWTANIRMTKVAG